MTSSNGGAGVGGGKQDEFTNQIILNKGFFFFSFAAQCMSQSNGYCLQNCGFRELNSDSGEREGTEQSRA